MPDENRLKLAILHIGQPRTYKRCLNNWIEAVSDYDVDFFVGAYDEHGHRLDPIRDNARQWGTHRMRNPSKGPMMDRTKIDVEEFLSDISVLNPKETLILSWEESDRLIRREMLDCGLLPDEERSKSKYTWLDLPTSLWHQYYLLKKMYELIDDPDQYDLIIRARLDTAWVGYPKFEKIDHVEHPHYHPKFPHDYLIVGPPHLMQRVCCIYDDLSRFFLDREKYRAINQEWVEAAYNAHCAFAALYTEVPSRGIDLTPTSGNAMSIIRTDMYPMSYDLTFLLEEEHSVRWRTASVNSMDNYNPS